MLTLTGDVDLGWHVKVDSLAVCTLTFRDQDSEQGWAADTTQLVFREWENFPRLVSELEAEMNLRCRNES